MSFNTNGAGNRIVGGTAGSFAPTGSVGSRLFTQIVFSSAVTLTNGTPIGLLSTATPIGNWHFFCNLFINGTSGSQTFFNIYIANSVVSLSDQSNQCIQNMSSGSFLQNSPPVGQVTFSTTSTSTTSLSVSVNFSGTATICGTLTGIQLP